MINWTWTYKRFKLILQIVSPFQYLLTDYRKQELAVSHWRQITADRKIEENLMTKKHYGQTGTKADSNGTLTAKACPLSSSSGPLTAKSVTRRKCNDVAFCRQPQHSPAYKKGITCGNHCTKLEEHTMRVLDHHVKPRFLGGCLGLGTSQHLHVVWPRW